MDRTKYYVRNEDLLREIRQYRETGRVSEELGSAFLRIAQGVCSRGSFRGYSFVEDMAADAATRMIQYLDSFDEAKGKPFSWASRIAFNSARSHISKLRRIERLEATTEALALHHGYDARPVDGHMSASLTSALFRPEGARRRGLTRQRGRLAPLGELEAKEVA